MVATGRGEPGPRRLKMGRRGSSCGSFPYRYRKGSMGEEDVCCTPIRSPDSDGAWTGVTLLLSPSPTATGRRRKRCRKEEELCCPPVRLPDNGGAWAWASLSCWCRRCLGVSRDAPPVARSRYFPHFSCFLFLLCYVSHISSLASPDLVVASPERPPAAPRWQVHGGKAEAHTTPPPLT